MLAHQQTLRRFASLFFSLTTLALAACEALPAAPTNDDTLSFSVQEEAADSILFAFATDYASSGILYFASVNDDQTQLIQTGITDLGSSATLHFSGELVFILHDGYSLLSSDNLEVLDPFDSFATVGQWSTGNGTNPQAVVSKGARAFISLYNPSADADNIDANGNPGDVIEMSLTDGTITQRYGFASDLQNDDAQAAHAHALLASGNTLYVGLQDLNPNTFEADAPGKIGIIDTNSDEIENVLTLTGRNPMALAISDDGARLFVAHMATYDYTTQTFNTDSAFGGLEIINLNTQTTEAFLNDEDFDGYIENVVAGDGKIYLHVSSDTSGEFTSRIITLPQATTTSEDATVFVDPETDIRAMNFNAGYLWLSLPNSGSGTPELRVYNTATKENLGAALTPVAPVMSLAGDTF